MDAVGVWAIVGVLIVGTAVGLWRRRTEGQFRDVSPSTNAGPRVRPPASTTPGAGTPRAGTAGAETAREKVIAELTPLAAGSQAVVDGSRAVVDGSRAEAGSSRAVASGSQAVADGSRAVASSPQAEAGRSRADAVGSQAVANGSQAVANGLPAAGSGNRPVSAETPASGAAVGGERLPTPDVRDEPGEIEADDPSAPGVRINAALLAELGVGPAQATLLQFSSAFCAPCRSVRRVSAEVAGMVPGVEHVEVDAESHLDAVRALGIWRTPTLLIVDGEGRIAKRATGVPTKPHLIAALGEVL